MHDIHELTLCEVVNRAAFSVVIARCTTNKPNDPAIIQWFNDRVAYNIKSECEYSKIEYETSDYVLETKKIPLYYL